MEFNIQPYNDDFEQNAKDNNYLRILFKPGFSVQARELTQIQSILQNQLKAFGDHIFQDGSPVIGGNLSLDNTVNYIKLDETYNNEDVELEQFVGNIILRDSDSLVQAKVLASYYPSGGTPTLMIKYLSGTTFADGDVFKIAGTTTRAKLIGSAASGNGTLCSINDGIFYVDGFFVQVNPQTAVVAAYSQNANVKIGLEVTDEIVDYAIDSTLLDPAQDSFNYQAPGADRYQFSLTLSTRPVDTAVDESKFFELMRVENGVITKQVKYAVYSEIEKTLARRTYDESGDYTVTPFRASVGDSANTDLYTISIEPGKAYVKGFEFETIGTVRMEAEKPRTVGIDTRSLVDIDFDTSYGNYLKFKNVWGSNTSSFIDTKNLEKVDIHCVTADQINIGVSATATANQYYYSNTKIGTVRIRNVKRDVPAQDGVANVDSNGIFDFYFTDMSIAPKVMIVPSNSSNANTVVLPTYASPQANAYQNTSITILPIKLTAINNISKANIFVGSARVNANSATANVFNSPNVEVGNIIRVGEYTRQVVRVNVTGDYIICNTAFPETIDATATDPLSVFVQSDYSSNVTNQTRVIERYDGATKTAFLDRPFDEDARVVSTSVAQLNFSVRDLKSLVDANTAAIKANATRGANAHANISVQSTLIDGATELFEGSDKSLLFPLPKNAVKRGSLNNIDYTSIKYYDGLVGAAGVFTLPVEAYESIPWSITNNNLEDNLIAVVRESSGALANGTVLKLNTGEVVPSGGGLQITLPATVSKIDAYVTVKVNDAEDRIRTKTYRSNTVLSIENFNYPTPSGVTINHTVTVGGLTVARINTSNGLIFVSNVATNVFPGDQINLYVPDIVNVRKILAGNVTHFADSTNYQDVTDHFVVDFGQSDEIYEHGKLILKQGYPSPNAELTVHVDFYEHTYPAGATFFSVDSYESTVYENGSIPVYYSDKLGMYHLRDCLDFRPTRRIGTDAGTLDVGSLPTPDTATELSFDYYLPRIDKLVLSKNKEFRIIKGISSPTPVPPDDSEDAMTMYTIYLPPYVSSISDIRMVYNDNRRYTMKDISKIDKRVEAIEYYTALNNVENRAMNDTSQYEDGTEKAKYGIIGESFKSFNISDYKDPDFSVSMKEGEMGPYIYNKAYQLKVVSVTDAKLNARTVSLNFTEEPMISQTVTSNKLVSVQPFLFAQFIGDVNLSPEIDHWVSEELKPDILRSPQTSTIIREINNTERIVERTIDRTVTITVPAPVINAAPIITKVPASDPPAPRPIDVIPVQVPPPPPVIPIAPVAPVPAPQPVFFPPPAPATPAPTPIPEPPPPVLPPPTPVFDVVEVIIPIIPAPPPPPPAPVPQTPLPIYSEPVYAGGGGCVVLESYIPWVDGQIFNTYEVRQAYQLQAGFKLWLGEGSTLETSLGTVKSTLVEKQPCVRVTTTEGTSLVCSHSAPLATLRGIVHAPHVLGEKVAVYKDNVSYWETVESVEEVGEKFVAVIDAHDNFFWAGEKEGAYILHHNALNSIGNVRKV